MSVPLDAITDICRGVALEHGSALQVVGVTSSEGGSDRVEILLTIAGCHTDPCRFVVNLSRAERAEFERQLRARLHAISAMAGP